MRRAARSRRATSARSRSPCSGTEHPPADAVGDVGRLHGQPCGCGRGLPTIELLGRASEQVRLSGGRVVAPSELFDAIDDPSIADARFRHRT